MEEQKAEESKLGIVIFAITIVLCALIIYYIAAPPAGGIPNVTD